MTELEAAAREYASCEVSEGGLAGLRGIEAGKIEPFIAGAQWQAEQSPWISVDERLPDVGVNVLVITTNKRYVLTNMYIPTDCHGNVLGEKEWHGSGVFKGSITHWMPIPSFDDILEANKDVLKRIKKKGD